MIAAVKEPPMKRRLLILVGLVALLAFADRLSTEYGKIVGFQ